MLLIGLLAIAGCSVDHVVVATLDRPSPVGSSEGGAADAGAGAGSDERTGAGGVSAGGTAGSFGRTDPQGAGGVSSGGTSGSAGSFGGSPSAGGVASTGGSGSGTIDTFITSGGGSSPVIRIGDLGGAGGDTSVLLCSCFDRASFVCGTDGFTYRGCSGEGCTVPTIACWHACPCLDGEPDPSAMTTWFPLECSNRCGTGVICMTFTDAVPDGSTSCVTGN